MTAWLGVTDPHRFPPFYGNRSVFFIINVFLIKKTFQVKVMLHETIRNDDF